MKRKQNQFFGLNFLVYFCVKINYLHMKIAYISASFFADVDFSYLKELRKKEDLYYLINLCPNELNSTIINIKKIYPKTGIFKASLAYKEFEAFKEYIDLDKTYVINRVSIKNYSISNLLLQLKLFFFLLKLKVDVIHTTYFYKLPEFLLYFFRKKTILTVHDPFPHVGEDGFRRQLYMKIETRLLSNFILLNSRQKDKFICRYKLQKKNVFISHLGVYDVLQAIPPMPLNEEKDYILFFGRISPYKGLEILFPAMKIVHEKCPDLKLIVAGGGNYYFDIEEYKKLGYMDIRNRFIPNEELVALIKSSIFVVCPYTDATQSGVFMSAFTFCKPVISSNAGGLSEAMHDGRVGTIVQKGSVEELAAGIISLYENKEKLDIYKKNIYELYYDGSYSWEKITEEMQRFYMKMS